MRRMKVEVSVGGGFLVETLAGATHLVVVSCPQLDVDFDMLLRGFSEAEKRLLRSRRLLIVKSQWLEDSIEKNQKLPEDSYNLKPQLFLDSSTGEGDEVNSGDEYCGPDNTLKKDAPSTSGKSEKTSKSISDKLRIVSLPDSNKNRKRGRPRGTSTRKEKSAITQPRRIRSRVQNKPAKINESESDKDPASDGISDSSQNYGSSKKLKSGERARPKKPRRTRAQIRNKSAQLSGNDSDEGGFPKEQTMEEDTDVNIAIDGPSETAAVLVPEVHTKEPEQDVETSGGNASESGVAKSSKPGQLFDKFSEVGSGSGTKAEYHNELQDTVDPIQAMLLNMVPVLALKKPDSSNPEREEFKSEGTASTREEEKFPLDNETQPVKKKKVSYKDVANELLKDW